jgi:flagellar motor switch protein FliN/FliY
MKESMLKKITVPIEVVLGRRDVSIENFSRFQEGTILALDALAGEPVEVVANGKTIAKAEVVVIDENFGVRITDLELEE